MNTKNTTDCMQLIQECRTSGLSDREWCSQNDIPASTFYYHIKHLREQACDIPASVSRKTAVRQEVVRLDIIDELPGTIRNEQISSRIHPGPPTLPESAAVRINCGGLCGDKSIIRAAGTCAERDYQAEEPDREMVQHLFSQL